MSQLERLLLPAADAIAVGLDPAPGAAPALFNLAAGIYRAGDWPGFLAAARHDDTGSYGYAGVDGTIANRMKGTPAANNVHAKTGTVAQSRSL